MFENKLQGIEKRQPKLENNFKNIANISAPKSWLNMRLVT